MRDEAERVDDVVAKPGWRIDSLGALEWALEMLADVERLDAETREMFDRAHARLERRQQELCSANERRIAFFRGHIAAFANERRPELLGKSKKKSRAFPYGSIAWRGVNGGLEVVDEATALAWCKEHGMVLTFVRPDKDALREHFKATGEVPPGFELRQSEERIYIKTTTDALALKEEE